MAGGREGGGGAPTRAMSAFRRASQSSVPAGEGVGEGLRRAAMLAAREARERALVSEEPGEGKPEGGQSQSQTAGSGVVRWVRTRLVEGRKGQAAEGRAAGGVEELRQSQIAVKQAHDILKQDAVQREVEQMTAGRLGKQLAVGLRLDGAGGGLGGDGAGQEGDDGEECHHNACHGALEEG